MDANELQNILRVEGVKDLGLIQAVRKGISARHYIKVLELRQPLSEIDSRKGG